MIDGNSLLKFQPERKKGKMKAFQKSKICLITRNVLREKQKIL